MAIESRYMNLCKSVATTAEAKLSTARPQITPFLLRGMSSARSRSGPIATARSAVKFKVAGVALFRFSASMLLQSGESSDDTRLEFRALTGRLALLRFLLLASSFSAGFVIVQLFQ